MPQIPRVTATSTAHFRRGDGSVQFSIARPLTRSNSVVLLVTRIVAERAGAAMKRSFAPIRAPRFFRSARIWA